MDLGKRIRRWRRKREITLRDLAKALNFSAGFFSDIERGKSKPSVCVSPRSPNRDRWCSFPFRG